jgi:DNA-directed RNA polymerase subunit RPC12/RpoP
MEWTLQLECFECGAHLVFANEKPEWLFEHGQRYVICPACGTKVEPAPKPRLDVSLNRAFAAFRPKASSQ